MVEQYLAHHGILGMNWGERHGPPYPLDKNPSRQAALKRNSISDYPGDSKKKAKSGPRHTGKEYDSRAEIIAARKARQEAKAKKKAEEAAAKKQQVLRGGSPKDVLKYQGQLSNQELSETIQRIKFENELKALDKQERAGKSVVNKIFSHMGVVSERLATVNKVVQQGKSIAKALGAFDDNNKEKDKKDKKKDKEKNNKESAANITYNITNNYASDGTKESTTSDSKSDKSNSSKTSDSKSDKSNSSKTSDFNSDKSESSKTSKKSESNQNEKQNSNKNDDDFPVTKALVYDSFPVTKAPVYDSPSNDIIQPSYKQPDSEKTQYIFRGSNYSGLKDIGLSSEWFESRGLSSVNTSTVDKGEAIVNGMLDYLDNTDIWKG